MYCFAFKAVSIALFSPKCTNSFFRSDVHVWKIQNALKHSYRKTFECHDLETFIRTLSENVCYNKDGLIILNKPYGVGVSHPPQNHKIPESSLLNTAAAGGCYYYLTDALPHLARILGYNHLEVIKSPGRYVSGITILSAHEEITKKVRRSVEITKQNNKVVYHFNALTVGVPEPASGSEKIGVTLQKGPGNRIEPVLETKYSKNSVKRGEVHTVYVDYKLLAQGPLASLVEIKTSRTKWHFVRLYLAYLLSPALGDNLYGSRVQTVLNIPVAISPFSDYAQMPQKLSKSLQEALKLQPNEEVIIPTHIHLKKIILENYEGNRTIKVEAPLPEYFLWSYNQLITERDLYSTSASGI